MPKLKPEQLDLSSIVEIITSQVQGTPGPTGTAGVNGYTPRKGIDYFDGAVGPTGTVGSPGSPGTTTWAGITDKPSTFTPTTHAHSPADVTGTAVVTNDARLSDARTPITHSHAPSEITGTAVVTADSRLSDARVPTSHDSTKHSVTYALPADITAHATLKTGAHGLLGNVMVKGQVAPAAKTSAVTLTIAELLTGIITGAPTAAAAYTLPTGTLCEGGLTIAINESFDWNLINIATTATYIITLTAGTGHTIVGAAAIPANSTTTGGLWGTCGATFRTRKTALNTFVTYRIG
jgi:hypothetical protein